MRGGFLIALDSDLFGRAASALVELGAARAVDGSGDTIVQLSDNEGRLFSLYERAVEGTEWEVREGTFAPAPSVELPDMNSVTACPFDCRWPELAASVARVIARGCRAPTWLLDGNGVMWDAKAVDPLKVQL